MQSFDTRQDMVSSFISKNSIIAEIGIFKGEFSKFLSALEPEKLFLIDLFEGITCSGDQDGNHVIHANMNEVFNSLSGILPGVSILKGDSSVVLDSINEKFDMIYIDGDHSYEGCKKDLTSAFKKIKNGGYIMGHDYEMNMNKAKNIYNFGVKRAVDEFCVQYNQKILAKAMDGCVSYAIKVVF